VGRIRGILYTQLRIEKVLKVLDICLLGAFAGVARKARVKAHHRTGHVGPEGK
jgi:hypothetical protein